MTRKKRKYHSVTAMVKDLSGNGFYKKWVKGRKKRTKVYYSNVGPWKTTKEIKFNKPIQNMVVVGDILYVTVDDSIYRVGKQKP